jgi:predicted nucleic acid-binding protein
VIVVDASLGLEMFLRGPDAMAIKDRIEAAGREMAVPEVFDLEIVQSLRRMAFRDEITQARASAAYDVFRHAPVERFSHQILIGRIWALRHNLTAYDAAYFALAEALGVPLWTRDGKFADLPGVPAVVEVL